jgi:hypothetical protein
MGVVSVLVLAGAATYLVTSSDSDGPSTTSERPAPSSGIAQLEGVPVTVYGDSWSAPGPWHSPGHHWSDQLAAHVGSLTNRGVGNSTMEDAANLVGGGSDAAWTVPDEPSCVIVMSVLNTARYPDDLTEHRAASEASMRAAATSVAGMILSDHFSEDRRDITTFIGIDWTAVANPNVSGGSVQGSLSGSVTFEVPEGYSDRQMWMATLIGPNALTFRLSKDGVELAVVETPISDTTTLGYTKHLLPIGKVTSGDTITVDSVAGGFWYDGMHIDNGSHHVVFATEPSHLPTEPPSPFDNEEQLDAHNDLLREVVDDVNRLVPDGASLVDLDAAPGWDDDALTGPDQIHPNDAGQDWIFEVVLRDLRANVPRTTRLSSD